MSFGRNKNMTRRAHRPDHDFHRLKRRKGLNHPMVGPGSLWRSVVHLLLTPFRRRK
jgi:hypothetical protein